MKPAYRKKRPQRFCDDENLWELTDKNYEKIPDSKMGRSGDGQL
jgi:hypothetical protein